ncbi:glycosyltransferase [Clostridium aestuarii]|uniref:Glycosyltransferase n=1 Tax=Clostridium aestuarii TaxID=338193 RepID=A0ABT4CVB3_9CLOT|nr:glycosyltransferase [Clostridium aestuarii]MCY6482757.1 glycosyltransferase [Clostridium aestuarii]
MKKKIVFFVLPGLDSFINDIINALSEKYDTKKVIVKYYNQIDEGMKWADVCWFEWCDALIIYGSKLEIAKEKKIICRIHSYEAFTNNISQVNWDTVDKIIFVAEHIRNNVLSKVKVEKEKTIVISNGVDLDKYDYKEREKGFNIAFIGYIDFKKGPMLLFHVFKAIFDRDNRYKLYIAGRFNEERYVLYFQQMAKEMGLEDNVIFDGWQDNIDKWLEDKNYILCTSVLESQNMSVMQAASKGIKPIVHNFVGAKTIYPQEYVWNTIDEAVKMISSDEYNSKEYRDFITKRYSLDNNIVNIKLLIKYLVQKNYEEKCNELPLVSICIPVYNGEKFINQAIITALQQSYENIEIIISDNCSTDNTVKIIESFNDRRIKLHKNSSNDGYLANLNKCLSMANGKYVKYLFADDILEKDNVKILTEIIEQNPDVNFVANNFRQINENNRIISGDLVNIGEGKYDGKYLFKVLIMYGDLIGAPSNILIRKETIDKINGFSDEYEYMHDYHAWVRLAREGNFYFMNRILSYFRIHSQSATTKTIASVSRVRDFYKLLREFINDNEFSKEDIKISYKNATTSSLYSLQKNNNSDEKLEMIDLILKEDKYLSDENTTTLNSMRIKLLHDKEQSNL